MPHEGTIIDIFVSSPGDATKYRSDILSIVQSWNQRNSRSRGLFFNTLRWEDFVAADIGAYSQDVANQQIGDEYDIFLGVMWSKFGTPTLVAESGTQEEFNKALHRFRDGQAVKVSFLFCTADVPQSQLDGVEYAKLQQFKSRVQSEGCLTRDFADDASLINALNMILDHFCNSFDKPQTPLAPEIQNSSNDSRIDDLQHNRMEFVSCDDDGILDVSEELLRHVNIFVSILGDWTARLKAVGIIAEKATQNISNSSIMGPLDAEQLRSIIRPVTLNMENFADWCDDKITETEACSSNVSINLVKFLEISRDFDTSDNFNEEILVMTSQMFEAIDSSNASLEEFSSVLENFPRLDKKMIKASRRLVMLHRRLIQQNTLMKSNLYEEFAEIDLKLRRQ